MIELENNIWYRTSILFQYNLSYVVCGGTAAIFSFVKYVQRRKKWMNKKMGRNSITYRYKHLATSHPLPNKTSTQSPETPGRQQYTVNLCRLRWTAKPSSTSLPKVWETEKRTVMQLRLGRGIKYLKTRTVLNSSVAREGNMWPHVVNAWAVTSWVQYCGGLCYAFELLVSEQFIVVFFW